MLGCRPEYKPGYKELDFRAVRAIWRSVDPWFIVYTLKATVNSEFGVVTYIFTRWFYEDVGYFLKLKSKDAKTAQKDFN